VNSVKLLTILAVARHSNFGEDYHLLKEKLTSRLLKALIYAYPELKGMKVGKTTLITPIRINVEYATEFGEGRLGVGDVEGRYFTNVEDKSANISPISGRTNICGLSFGGSDAWIGGGGVSGEIGAAVISVAGGVDPWNLGRLGLRVWNVE